MTDFDSYYAISNIAVALTGFIGIVIAPLCLMSVKPGIPHSDPITFFLPRRDSLISVSVCTLPPNVPYTLPGQLALGAFLPSLIAAGNSIRSMHAIRHITGEPGVGLRGPNPE